MALNNIDFTKDRYKEQLAALEAARLAKGLTYAELAEQLGIERKTFYNWENKKDFPVSMLKKMADIFGITTDKLLGIEQS